MRFHNINKFLFLIQLEYQYANLNIINDIYLYLSMHIWKYTYQLSSVQFMSMYTYKYVYVYIHIYGLPKWWGWYRIHQLMQETKRCGFDPWVGKIPWRRAWQPIPIIFPSLKNPVARGPWCATVYRATKSWTWLKQLRTHTSMHTNIYLHTCNFFVHLTIFYELFLNKTVSKFLMSKC